MTDIEELYNDVKKKADLPDFQDIDEEFEISDIEELNFFLRKIRRKIVEKIESFEKIMEYILHPEASFASMFECKEFSDQEMSEVFETYKKIKLIETESNLLEVDGDYKKEAEFIKYAFSEWLKLKPDIVKIIKKSNLCWKKEETKIKFESYVG